MGSSAPKSETVVKGGKPTIVREWLSPQYLKQLGQLSQYYGQRAMQERSTYQDVVNRERSARNLPPLFGPMKTTTGETVAPGIVSVPFDTTDLVTAGQESGMFNAPKAPEPKKDKPKEPRESYLGALNVSKIPVNTNN